MGRIMNMDFLIVQQIIYLNKNKNIWHTHTHTQSEKASQYFGDFHLFQKKLLTVINLAGSLGSFRWIEQHSFVSELKSSMKGEVT